MKKTTFYKIGALSLTLLGAGVFTSFDDAMTDEQKIEAAYNQMVMDFKAEQTELCKTQALEMAQAEWARMQAGGSESGAAPTYSGSSATRNISSSSSGSEEPPAATTGGNVDNTPPPPPKEDPNAATTKGGAVQQGTGSVTTKGGATQTSGDNKSGSNTSVSTKGGAVKK
jgi:hypothetical protein